MQKLQLWLGLQTPAAVTAMALLSFVAISGSGAAAASPASVTIPFLNTEGSPVRQLQGSPLAMISVNGGHAVLATVDTGSTTLVVTPDNFPLSANAIKQGPGQVNYDSSGITEYGTYYLTDVVIGGVGTTATSHVPVLRVYKITQCNSSGGNCTSNYSPTGTAYMGVGFGRGGSGAAPTKSAAYNPFLNITHFNNCPVKPVRGYIMQSSGVTLGLTTSETAKFRPLKLTWNKTLGDWASPSVGISVTPPGGQSVTGTGTVLTDTGVNHMYLTPPAAVPVQVDCKTCLARGTKVGIYVGGMAKPVLYYSVGVDKSGNTTADPENAAPAFIYLKAPATAASPVFVNTSYFFLNAFSYYYNYDNGYVGYMKN